MSLKMLNVALVLVILIMANANARPAALEEESDQENEEGFSDWERLAADRKIWKELPDPVPAGNQNVEHSLLDSETQNLRFEAEKDPSINENEYSPQIAREDDEAELAEIEYNKLSENDEEKRSQNDGSLEAEEHAKRDEVIREESENLAAEEEINADTSSGGGRNKRYLRDMETADEDDGEQQEDENDEESGVGQDQTFNNDDESAEDINNDDEGVEDLNEEISEVDVKSDESNESEDDNAQELRDENEDSGKNKREIVTQIEKTLNEVQSLDSYLEYLNKRADQLEDLPHDISVEYSGSLREEADRSKRESSKISPDRPVDYLKSLPQYRDVPREVLANAVQSLANGNGERFGRHLESREPVQRQAAAEQAAPGAPCSGTTKEPQTKEEQELQRVIELRKKHEANVAKEQDEVVKAEHMAHAMQEDLQEAMNEIRGLKKEISVERREADTINVEVKADQNDLEEHDQKKFNARRHVDDLYMKLTELESQDCEGRSKRQLARHLRDIVGTEKLDAYESPRQRMMRELHERDREQAEVETMMKERQSQGVASDIQDVQKQVRNLQRAEEQGNDQPNADEVQDPVNQQQDQLQADSMEPDVRQPNELVQRSVNAQVETQAAASGAAPAIAPAPVPRQAGSECPNPQSESNNKHNQYNALLQEIIIGEAKVKVEAVEVERAEQEVASSRKRLSAAMSHLSALLMELKNLQARAVNAGKRAKEAHLVLAYHDQLLFNERKKVTEALNLETDLQKMISDLKIKSGKCSSEEKKP